MPPRGVNQGTKRARQYEHIKQSEQQQSASHRIPAGPLGVVTSSCPGSP